MSDVLRRVISMMGKSPSGLSFTIISEAYGNGSASLASGNPEDLVLGFGLGDASVVPGGTMLRELAPGYGSGVSYVITGSAVTMTATYDCWLVRLRPSKAITSITAGSTVSSINTSTGSVASYGSTGTNIVVAFGQQQTYGAFVEFTGLTNMRSTTVRPAFGFCQVALNPIPSNSAPFTVTGGTMYPSTYAGAVQLNVN